MAAKNERAITRDDLTESIKALGTLVDSKLDRVLDRVTNLREDIRIHAEAFNSVTVKAEHRLSTEIERIDQVHENFQKTIEGLQRYRWQLVGALAMLGLIFEALSHLILKK